MRKAESMGTTTAEPLAVLEKKIKHTEDDALLVGNEAEKKSRTIRSDEARTRKLRSIINAGEHGRSWQRIEAIEN